MDREEIIARQHIRKRNPKVKRTLMGEYLRNWYVLVLTILMCVPGYVCEVILYNSMMAKGLSAFGAAFLAILLGGLITTLPFLILNIVLCVKKKMYYSIVFQVCLMEILGLVFFLYNQIQLTGV